MPRIYSTKKLSLFLFSLTATIVILEIVLQIWSSFSPSLKYLLARDQARVIQDPRLGVRPNPFHPEHDSNGFRNRYVPKEACIVALGDSQTYGHKVQPHQAWPQQLEQLTVRKVYNMAYGGYGPVHSLVLWPEAMALKPKLIIEALYFGNDFYDAYHLVYENGQFPELVSKDETVLAAIKKAGKDFDFGPPTHLGHQQLDLVSYFLERSALYGLVRAARRAYRIRYGMTDEDIYFATDWEFLKKEAKARKGFWVFDGGKVKTIFASEGRAAALDLKDPRIAEGFRIALETLRLMNSRAKDSHIQFLALLLPTKELVFSKAVLGGSEKPPVMYSDTIQREESLRAFLIESLDSAKIPVIDALPPLREALDSGNQPYSISADGHKNSAGHAVVAKTILAALQKNFPEILRDCTVTTP